MYKVIKRCIDLILSFLGLVICMPLFIFIGVAIKLDSKGSIIFAQKRIGQFAKPFRIFKFRTMISNASSIGPSSTSDGDTRITRVGHILRKTSLDELPQLFNIFIGDMSLVGYRPGVCEDYTEEELKSNLFSVKPGITGNAQVNGRSKLNLEQKRAYEMDYVNNICFLTDLRLIFKTVSVVLLHKGVN